jgi:peptidoglycan/LPS O-acetylase OafA/YrhL
MDMKFMNKDFTMGLKGFSILTVVWAHSGARLGVGGIQFIAGVGVALFLICSGYGLERSYQKNGLKSFWKKRIMNVAIPFWIVEMIGLLITGNFSVKAYSKDFIFIKPATAYGWFMGYIIICYIFFWGVKVVSQRLSLTDKQEMLLMMLLFALLFIYESTISINLDMPFLKARQMLSFSFGVLIGKYKKEIEKFICSKKLLLISGGV